MILNGVSLLIGMEKLIGKRLDEIEKKLTLGSFSFQLGRIVNPNDFDSSVIVDENVIEALATPVGADDPNTRGFATVE